MSNAEANEAEPPLANAEKIHDQHVKSFGTPKKTVAKNFLSVEFTSSQGNKETFKKLTATAHQHSQSKSPFSSINSELDRFLEEATNERQRIFASSRNSFYVKEILREREIIMDPDFKHQQKLDSIFNRLDAVMNKEKERFLLLVLEHASSPFKSDFFAILGGQWADSSLEPEDKVEIIGFIDQETQSIFIHDFCPLDASGRRNYLVLEPDVLVDPSTVRNTMPCYRRALIQSNYSSTTQQANEYFLKGEEGSPSHRAWYFLGHTQKRQNICSSIDIDERNLIHLLFEEFIRQKDVELKIEDVNAGFFRLARLFMEEFYALKKNVEEFFAECQGLILNLTQWINKFVVRKEPLSDSRGAFRFEITKVIKTEPMLTAASWGIKGKIDVLLFCSVVDVNDTVRNMFVPFELKTGRKSDRDTLQTLMYCILVNSKYAPETLVGNQGILLYLNDGNNVIVSLSANELSSLILRRNKLARLIKRFDLTMELPPTLKNSPRDCSMCSFKEECSALALSKSVVPDIEDGFASELNTYQEIKEKLTIRKAKYIRKWINLCQIEENYEKNISRLYKNASQTSNLNRKEDLTVTMTNLQEFVEDCRRVLFSEEANEANSSQNRVELQSLKIVLQKEVFDKAELLPITENIRSSNEIKVDSKELGIHLKAKVDSIHREKGTQRKLSESGSSALEEFVLGKRTYIVRIEAEVQAKEILANFDRIKYLIDWDNLNIEWNIEKIERQYMVSIKNAVLRLAVDPEQRRLADLLIEGKPPRFENEKFIKDRADFEAKLLANYNVVLNDDQKDALFRCLKAQDYSLIWGMPGTGKTFLIALLVKILFDLGQTVLLTSYTHSALDNMIKRIIELFKGNCGMSPGIEEKIVRFASDVNIVEESVRGLAYQRGKHETLEQFTEYFEKFRIFAVTCLSTNNVLLNSMKFDYCIIDEASQTIEPMLLGAVTKAEKFFLIGDFNQLQPLIKCKFSQEKGMDKSLFERLYHDHRHISSDLTYQFRMNKDIMLLCNSFIYNNRLKAATKEVESGTLNVDHVKFIDTKWLHYCFHPENSVIFLNFDQLSLFQQNGSNSQALVSSKEMGSDSKFLDPQNKWLAVEKRLELELAATLIKHLVKTLGVNPEQIGVITVYNEQRSKLSKKTEEYGVKPLTVDKSQGLDKDCFVLICSRKSGNEHLLNNWRRVNVAFSRAKKKLIVIGSLSYLEGEEDFQTLKKFIGLMCEKKWVYNFQDEDLASLTMKTKPAFLTERDMKLLLEVS